MLWRQETTVTSCKLFMFIEKTEVCNFADDNTIYDCGKDLSNVLENLKHDLTILLKWFRKSELLMQRICK